MTDTPNSALNESLSALMDGENSDLDIHRVLKAVQVDDSVRQTWSRYHAAGHVARGGSLPDLSIDISQSVMKAIEEEPAVTRQAGRLNSWWRGAGKTAVAACATVGVVYGVQQFSSYPDDNAVESSLVANSAVDQNDTVLGSTVPQGFELPPLQARTVSTNTFTPQTNLQQSPAQQTVTTTWVVSSDALQEQINRLMFKHAEKASLSGGMGTMPFARVSELSENEDQE